MAVRSGVSVSLLAAASVAVGPWGVEGQTETRVRVEENFRREPNGVVLARLEPGAPVRVLAEEGSWTRVQLQGWVWLRSLQAGGEPDFDLVVAADGGENLRAAPAGPIVARLEEGALLEEVDREPAWARVARTGWVWSASLDVDRTSAASSGAETAPAAAEPAAGRAPGAAGAYATVGPDGGPLLAAPDGDTLAVAAPGRDLEILGREGSWVRVRVEGWMWMPSSTATGEPAEAAPAELDPAELAAEPEAHIGRVVSWPLQFISLERAEAVRTDFFVGEPFLLTRHGGPDGPFVYVALAPERLAEVEGLVPLERVSVTARVRTGASVLTGTPIVDLLSIERSREAP